MTPHFADWQLKETLARPGCPLCHLAREAVRRFLAHLLYESVNDPGVQHALASSRGFCNLHAWQLREVGDALGTAILYRGVLRKLLESLEKRAPRSWFGPALRTILLPQAPCPACRVREEAEGIYAETLLKHLNQPEVRDGLVRAGGLCIPHLRRTLEAVSQPEQARQLLTLQQQAWTQLLAQLDEFIRKQDYRFLEEAIGPEGDSWIRALTQVSGGPGVW